MDCVQGPAATGQASYDPIIGDEYRIGSCRVTKLHQDGGVFWTARADHLNPLNQMLFVSGFLVPVADSHMRGQDVEITYDLAIRYKNKDSQEWKHMFPEATGTTDS